MRISQKEKKVAAFVASTDQLLKDDLSLTHTIVYQKSGVEKAAYYNIRSKGIMPRYEHVEQIARVYPKFIEYYNGYMAGTWDPNSNEELDQLIAMKDELLAAAKEAKSAIIRENESLKETIRALNETLEVYKRLLKE